MGVAPFTGLSAVLLGVVGAGVLLAALRGHRRGFIPTVISLSGVILSALVAAPLAEWLSDFPAEKAGELLFDLVSALETLSGTFPSLNVLVVAGADALISPLIFLILFGLMRGITGIVAGILLRGPFRPRPDDTGDSMYEGDNAPWHRRHGRLMGGMIGGICGFIVSLILLSPVVGYFSFADTLLTATDSFKLKWSSFGVAEEQIETVRDTLNDPVATLLEATGGGLIFDSYAGTRLNDRRVYLRREAEACTAVVTDFASAMKLLQKPGSMTSEQRETLANLGDRINGSEAAKLLAADTLNNVAKAWLDGRPFMKLSRPAFGERIESLMMGALEVCSESTSVCVGRDISTLLNIYLIAADNGLLSDMSYDELANSLEAEGVLDLIYNELLSNPCMVHLASKMTDMALSLMASALEYSDFDKTKLDGLMGDLSDALNSIKVSDMSNAERVESLKKYTLEYAEKYGVKLPNSLAEMAAVAFMEKLGGGGKVTPDDLYELLRQYAKG